MRNQDTTEYSAFNNSRALPETGEVLNERRPDRPDCTVKKDAPVMGDGNDSSTWSVL